MARIFDRTELAEAERRVADLDKRVADQKALMARSGQPHDLAQRILQSYETLFETAVQRRDDILAAMRDKA